jgi:hypothetical protein
MKTLKCLFVALCVLCSAGGVQVQADTLQDSTLTILGVWTNSTGFDCSVFNDLVFVTHKENGLSILM